MSRIAAFFRWLGTPFRSIRGWVPFTHDGRQTLIYLIFAGAGPALTLVGLHILEQTEGAGQWGIYATQARIFGWSLFVIVAGLGMFVSIRSFKIGKEGLDFTGKDTPDPVAAAQKVASEVTHKAKEAVAEVAVAAADAATAKEDR